MLMRSTNVVIQEFNSSRIYQVKTNLNRALNYRYLKGSSLSKAESLCPPDQVQRLLIKSAPRSAMAYVGACVCPQVTNGCFQLQRWEQNQTHDLTLAMIEASTMRSPETPLTNKSGLTTPKFASLADIAAVPTGCDVENAVPWMNSSNNSSVVALAKAPAGART